MLNEDNVLFLLKEFLLNKGWNILSYKSPGGHGGISIKINNNQSFILDMIAYLNPFVICIEAKAKYSDRDRDKLNLIFSDVTIFEKLRNCCIAEIKKKNLPIINNLVFIKALAFSMGDNKQKGFITFQVNKFGDITSSIGENVPIQVKNFL